MKLVFHMWSVVTSEHFQYGLLICQEIKLEMYIFIFWIFSMNIDR